MKYWIPWICFLVSLAALGAVYLSDQKKEAQLVQLSADNQELQKSLAAAEESKKSGAQSQNEELTRLRKDNEDLLRLRNEVRQLRDGNQQLTKQAQTAQAQAQTAQTQVQTARAQAQAAAQAAQAAAQKAVEQNASTAKEKANACINNLRQIDAAKQQWALENSKTADAIPTAKDIAPYLGKDNNGALPVCPAGGTYTINAVNAVPTCSVPGHALQ
jgi:TolA-binding protein